MQKRQEDLNIEVNFQIYDMLAIDRWTPELDYFIEQTDSANQPIKNTSKPHYSSKRVQYIKTGKAFLHSESPHLPLIQGQAKLCLIESESLHKRAQALHIAQVATGQLFADLAELKNNPMQV